MSTILDNIGEYLTKNLMCEIPFLQQSTPYELNFEIKILFNFSFNFNESLISLKNMLEALLILTIKFSKHILNIKLPLRSIIIVYYPPALKVFLNMDPFARRSFHNLNHEC